MHVSDFFQHWLFDIKYHIRSSRYIDLNYGIGLPAVYEFNIPEWRHSSSGQKINGMSPSETGSDYSNIRPEC